MKTLKLEDFKANTKEWFLEQLGNMPASQALQTISNLYDELHKPTYPKTYEECCDVIGINPHEVEIDIPRPYQQNMFNLFKLLICKDAYWKIAGEQMGLGKPWKPDWTNENQPKYGLYNELKYSIINPSQFVFPTIEMRDEFYNNFKDLIEQCKELL